MKRNKIKTYICHGFNNYFDVPDISSRCRATCRTAVVVKKVDFFDNWKVYDALVWRVIQRVATDLSAEMKIKCPDSKAGFVNSLSQWKRCQEDAAKEDSEFEENTPSEITFLKGGVPICLMVLEDWSDIGKIEPYAASYTYSFYCCDANMDMMISKAIKVQLSEEDEVGEICKYQEAPTPKWYWHLLDLIKGDTFFICAGFIVLALFAIVMIIVSPFSKVIVAIVNITINELKKSYEKDKKIDTIFCKLSRIWNKLIHDIKLNHAVSDFLI